MSHLMVGIVVGERGCLDGGKLLKQLGRKVLLLGLRLLWLRPKRDRRVLGRRVLGEHIGWERGKQQKKETKCKGDHVAAKLESGHGRWSVYPTVAKERNTVQPLSFSGSEQESVTHPHEMGILIFWNSGYTRQDERDGLDQSSGLAGVSGLSSRDQRTGENVEAMGTAEAREPEVGMFRMWAEVERSL